MLQSMEWINASYQVQFPGEEYILTFLQATLTTMEEMFGYLKGPAHRAFEWKQALHT